MSSISFSTLLCERLATATPWWYVIAQNEQSA